MKNKKGFTLIELLAVIVILGILMLIAIPSVTKYINSSKKETYAKSLSSMVDVVRYGVISGSSKYSLGSEMEKTFSLKDIELEKGSNKSPYGDYIEESSYIKVVKNGDTYDYLVQVKDTGGYCIALTNINNLTKDDIKKCEEVNIPDVTTYEAYSVGDQITFAGSNWYVIKNSTVEEDYVTVLKESNLTISELGSLATSLTCKYSDVTAGLYGCVEEGEKIESNEVAYYHSDTCHFNGTYNYTDTVTSGCSGHNDYVESKVKEFLEGAYINTLGETQLKEINGYKIRLITLEELQSNLGYSQTIKGSFVEHDSELTPSWVYQNSYFTMSAKTGDSQKIWRVNKSDARIVDIFVNQSSGIRPVINLLKTSIN